MLFIYWYRLVPEKLVSHVAHSSPISGSIDKTFVLSEREFVYRASDQSLAQIIKFSVSKGFFSGPAAAILCGDSKPYHFLLRSAPAANPSRSPR